MPKFMFILCCLLLVGCIEASPGTANGSNNGSNNSSNNSSNNGIECRMSQTLCEDGCVNLNRDLNNCGSCGEACLSQPNSSATCVPSGCVYQCASGRSDANEDLGTPGGDGCEADCVPNNDEEICNGVDDDCNGFIDEDLTNTYYLDEDGDGYGGIAIEACALAADTTLVTGDCDDTNPNSYPGAPEICDFEDNDCDDKQEDGSLPKFDCPLSKGVCSPTLEISCTLNTTTQHQQGCQYSQDYELSETSCSDGLDNDCNGYADCKDIVCANQPECDHSVLFVTDRTFNGKLGSLVGADTKCQTEANLGRWDPTITWKAVLAGNDFSLTDRINTTQAVKDPNGNLLANANMLFAGPLSNPPNVKPDGVVLTELESQAWTGTSNNGSDGAGNCHGWTSSLGAAIFGDPHSKMAWLNNLNGEIDSPCAQTRRLYCISQP